MVTTILLLSSIRIYTVYIYILILNLKCINRAGKRLGTALGALAKKVRRYCPDDAMSCCMYRKSEVLQQPIPSHNDYRGITCLILMFVENIISIYKRMANEALLGKITHGKTQNQNESLNSIHKLNSIRNDWSSC